MFNAWFLKNFFIKVNDKNIKTYKKFVKKIKSEDKN